MEEHQVYSTRSLSKTSLFLMDSGATCHVTNEKSDLIWIRPDRTKITVAENLFVKTTVSGSMILRVQGMKENDEIILERVFYVPESKAKIISIRRLTDEGYCVIFSKSRCDIRTPRGQGTIVIEGDAEGLNFLQAEALNQSQVERIMATTMDRGATDINLAHELLGHMNEKQLRRTYKAAGKSLKG